MHALAQLTSSSFLSAPYAIIPQMQDGQAFISSEGVAKITILILVDVALLLYAALMVLPICAMAMAVGSHSPKHMLREMKKDKERDELEDHQKGVGG